MLPPRKQNRVVAGLLWAVRALVVIVGGVALYNGWFNLDAEKLANVVTVLTAVLAVWALFDRTFLDWIVRKIRRAWERVRHSPGEERATSSPVGLSQSTPSVVATANQPEETSNEPTDEIVDPTIGCGFGIVLAILVLIFFSALPFAPQIWTTIFSGEQAGKPQPPPPLPPPPLPPPPPRLPIKYLVKEGDSCWAIANACTGDPDRLVELGPPLNPIDVRHPLCPIRAGSTINLPAVWTGCPRT